MSGSAICCKAARVGYHAWPTATAPVAVARSRRQGQVRGNCRLVGLQLHRQLGADSSRSPIAIKSRASTQAVLGASWLTCRYGCSTGHQGGEIRRREAATEISSLAVIGLPPSTFSRDRHERLDTRCAMVGRRDKKRSVSFSLGDGGLPFGAFHFCEARENSLLHDGDPRSLGRVDGSQLRKAR